ncbi:MAG: hypothetical protein JNM56_11940 [Planctomycetia bacterium]|nr:hypothetical protein [Planctomycetia bacterium]
MIAFSCPRCQHALTRHESEGGSKIACPGCGQRLQVPQPPRVDKTVLGQLSNDAGNKTVIGELLPAPLLSTPRSVAANPAPVPDPFVSSTALRCVCPGCQALMSVNPRRAGSLADCPRCKTTFEVPVPRQADLLLDATPAALTALPPALPVAAPAQPTDLFAFEEGSAPEPVRRSYRSAKSSGAPRLLLGLGLALTLVIGLCGGFGWMAMRSSQESRFISLQNQIASSDSKLNALDIELSGAVARGDAGKAALLLDSLAWECEQQAKDLDELAVRLSAGDERDFYVRRAQDRRTRAQTCRAEAAVLRANRR